MGRQVVEACLPWAGLLAASVLVAWLLARLSGARPEPARLRKLHRDEGGAVQSLAFVLVLPFFVMIILFMIQVSQLMIGTVVVHYSAYAAARAAVVWVPANLGMEPENCISAYAIDWTAPDTVMPVTDPDSPAFGPSDAGHVEGLTYLVQPGSPKYNKVFTAAVLACMPIAPSRDLGLAPPAGGPAGALEKVYKAMSPRAAGNRRIDARIENKLAYAAGNTRVEVRIFHSNTEPPLILYPLVRDDQGNLVGYQPNEFGWRDPVTVTVWHKMALLPGPGRFLARDLSSSSGSPDLVSRSIQQEQGVYKYELTASATLGVEGEKPVIPYVHR